MALITLPYDFVGGTRAIADQVNANFDAVANAVNTNVRTGLSGPTTFYVAPGGADMPGNGLAATSPAATVNYILDLIQATYDINGQVVTIQLATGSYNQSIVLNGPFVGAVGGSTTAPQTPGLGAVTVQGNVAAPSSVVIIGAVDVNNGGTLTLRGLTLQNAGNMDGVSAWGNSTITVDTCNHNANQLIESGGMSLIWLQGPQTINANTPTFIDSYDNSLVYLAANAAITLAAGVTITTFANARSAIISVLSGATFAGANTGARFRVTHNGFITNSGAAFPGVAPNDTNCGSGGRYSGPDGNFPSVYQAA